MHYENSMPIKYKDTIYNHLYNNKKGKLSHISDAKYGYVM